MKFPIISMEIEGMRHKMKTALLSHKLQMDEDISRAVDEFCKPENIKKIIDNAAVRALESAVQQEVENFFKFGAGRATVIEAVKERFKNE